MTNLKDMTTDEIANLRRGQRLLASVTMDVDGPTIDPTDPEEWKRTAAHWSVTLKRGDRTHEADYWMGEGLCTYKPTGHVGRAAEERHRAEGRRVVYNHYGPGKDAIATPRPPKAVEVIQSLALDASVGDQPFGDFCADLGYDTDSRKAYAAWEQCRNVFFDLRTFWGADFDAFIDTDWDEVQCNSD